MDEFDRVGALLAASETWAELSQVQTEETLVFAAIASSLGRLTPAEVAPFYAHAMEVLDESDRVRIVTNVGRMFERFGRTNATVPSFAFPASGLRRRKLAQKAVPSNGDGAHQPADGAAVPRTALGFDQAATENDSPRVDPATARPQKFQVELRDAAFAEPAPIAAPTGNLGAGQN